jgi:hypothetical protein
MLQIKFKNVLLSKLLKIYVENYIQLHFIIPWRMFPNLSLS